jgi:alkylation response protein AidB-like acyl-CoA dehydrogenase
MPRIGQSSALTELRLQLRGFLESELEQASFTPAADAWLSGIDTAFSRRLASHGWVGMTIPAPYGGPGRSGLERFVVTEELPAAGAPVGAHWVADRQIVPSLLRNGTEHQRRPYLPGIAEGSRFFAIGMSEPDSGSDPASVHTKAYPVPEGWVISGTKLWTSSAHIATNLVILARTDAATDRHSGLSQFIIDLPHPGIHIRPIVTIDGGHHFNEIVFDDATMPAESLLGQRGAGWRQVVSELANERSGQPARADRRDRRRRRGWCRAEPGTGRQCGPGDPAGGAGLRLRGTPHPLRRRAFHPAGPPFQPPAGNGHRRAGIKADRR